MGVEPSSPCAQLEHLPDLLRNTVNSPQNPSLYEAWRQKIAEDTVKQMVRRLHWDGKVPGICVGTRLLCPRLGYCLRKREGELDHQLPVLPELEVAEGNRD